MSKISSKLILLSSLILINLALASVRADEDTSTPPEAPQQSTSILQAILSLFQSPEQRFITRGDEVCLISPGDLAEQMIWSDRPLFIWQGEIPESEISLTKLAESFSEEEQVVWTQTVPEKTQTIAYTGASLEPSTYKWKLVANDTTYRQTITLMPESEREAIATELTDLENQLASKGTSKEEIAIARADFFTDRGLGYDALQQLYSVPNPSANLKSQINEIEQYFCNLNE